MAVGDHFRLALVGTYAAQQIVNVFHYRQTTVNVSGNTDVNELASAFSGGTLTDLLAATVNAYTANTIESRTFPLPGIALMGVDVPVGLTGDLATPGMPPSVAVVLKRLTAFLGRKYRGRIFLVGCPRTAVTGGTITDAGQLTLYSNFSARLNSAITSGNAGAPTFQPELNVVVPLVPGPGFGYRATDVTNAVVTTILRSQRRREVGVGS